MKPNILFILCDQWRWDCLGVMGHRTVETPNLDALASEGVLFTNAYSPAPSCVPARASLFTGKAPHRTGFMGYIDGKEWNYNNMLPEVFRNNGYQTHCVGKTHFYPQWKRGGFEGLESYEAWQNFDGTYVNDYHEWLHEKSNGQLTERHTGLNDNSWTARPSSLPEHLHNNTWVVTKGLEFIRRRDKTRPYFLNLSFHRPHPPIDPPKDYWDIFMGKECEDVPVGDWASKFDKPVTSTNTWYGRLQEDVLRRTRLAYYAQIAHIDNQIGRLMDELRRMNAMPDMIVFTSDHGEMLGDHHLFRKTYAYEGSAAVPLIIKTPKCSQGLVRDEAVVLQDLYTTMLREADIEVSEDIDGLDLGTVLQKDGVISRQWIHGEHSSCYSADEAMQFMTDGKTKYIWFTHTGHEQLFDLTVDPYECKELSQNPEYQGTLSTWRQRMIEHLAPRVEDGLSDGEKLICGLTPAYRQVD